MARASTLVALLLAAGLCRAADARMLVVSPQDDHGAPLEYPWELPSDAGGATLLTWDHVEELAPVIVAGAVLDEACDARSEPSIDDALDEALRLMTGLDAEAAVGLLEDLVGELPCLTEPVSSFLLADIYYHQAAAWAFLGDEDRARGAMQRAVAIEPTLEPDEGLPGKINTMLYEERAERRLVIGVRIRTDDELVYRIDGLEGAREFAVHGVGLLQWREGDRWRSALLRDPGEEVVIGTPTWLEGNLERGGDPFLPDLAAALGDALYHPLRIDQALFWAGGDDALVWDALDRACHWDGDESYGDPDDWDTPDAPPPVTHDDHFRLVAGGGLTYLYSFPWGAVGAEMSILIYKRFSFGLGLDLANSLSEFNVKPMLPLLHVGPRVRLGPRDASAQPWVGAAFRAGLENRDGVNVGILGGSAQIGVDLVPVKHFLLRAVVEGGFIEQQGHVHAKIAVGFGV
jgi:hypothetical protein